MNSSACLRPIASSPYISNHYYPWWACPCWSQLKTTAAHCPWTEWGSACRLHFSHGPIFTWGVGFHQWGFQRRAYSWEALWEVQKGDLSPQISTIHVWTVHIDCWSSFGRWICGRYISWGFIDEGIVPPLDGVHHSIFFSPHFLANNSSVVTSL